MKINYKRICNKFGVKLVYIKSNHWKDGGESFGDTICLYQYSKKWIEEISFWHELGHVVLNTKTQRTHYLSKISCEGAAWEMGLDIAASYGRIWKYGSKEMVWARKQLASYTNSEYDDLKEYYRR
jgi:hypothetical protein